MDHCSLFNFQNWYLEFKKWLGTERLNVYAVSTDQRAEVRKCNFCVEIGFGLVDKFFCRTLCKTQNIVFVSILRVKICMLERKKKQLFSQVQSFFIKYLHSCYFGDLRRKLKVEPKLTYYRETLKTKKKSLNILNT